MRPPFAARRGRRRGCEESPRPSIPDVEGKANLQVTTVGRAASRAAVARRAGPVRILDWHGGGNRWAKVNNASRLVSGVETAAEVGTRIAQSGRTRQKRRARRLSRPIPPRTSSTNSRRKRSTRKSVARIALRGPGWFRGGLGLLSATRPAVGGAEGCGPRQQTDQIPSRTSDREERCFDIKGYYEVAGERASTEKAGGAISAPRGQFPSP